MAIAKVMEISSESPEGFEDAMRRGIARATKTIDQVKSAWIKDQSVVLDGSKIASYRVNMKVTFVLNE